MLGENRGGGGRGETVGKQGEEARVRPSTIRTILPNIWGSEPCRSPKVWSVQRSYDTVHHLPLKRAAHAEYRAVWGSRWRGEVVHHFVHSAGSTGGHSPWRGSAAFAPPPRPPLLHYIGSAWPRQHSLETQHKTGDGRSNKILGGSTRNPAQDSTPSGLITTWCHCRALRIGRQGQDARLGGPVQLVARSGQSESSLAE